MTQTKPLSPLSYKIARAALMVVSTFVLLGAAQAVWDSVVSITQHYHEHKPVQYSPFLFLLLLLQPLMHSWFSLSDRNPNSI